MSATKIEKIVYFVRHGQSEDNVTDVFQSPHSPLNGKGRKQAQCIAERVSKISFETLIASPLERAKQTAEAIARATGKSTEYSNLFIECMKPSCVDGKPYRDEQANILWREWTESLYTPNLRVQDGENFDDLLARVDAALAFLKKREEKLIVVVTHGYFLRTIIARVLLGDFLSGETLREFQRAATMENTGLTVLRYHGGFEAESSWRFWVYNDHAHLG